MPITKYPCKFGVAVTKPVDKLICIGTPPNILEVLYGANQVIVVKGGFTGTVGHEGGGEAQAPSPPPMMGQQGSRPL